MSNTSWFNKDEFKKNIIWPGRVQEAADAGQGRQVQRLSSGRHGLPRRLHRRCRHHCGPCQDCHPAEQVCQGSSVCGPRGEPVHEQHPHAERRSQLRGLSTCLSAASRLPGGGFLAVMFSTFLIFYVESATVL